jgi:hypothetical protein
MLPSTISDLILEGSLEVWQPKDVQYHSAGLRRALMWI